MVRFEEKNWQEILWMPSSPIGFGEEGDNTIKFCNVDVFHLQKKDLEIGETVICDLNGHIVTITNNKEEGFLYTLFVDEVYRIKAYLGINLEDLIYDEVILKTHKDIVNFKVGDIISRIIGGRNVVANEFDGDTVEWGEEVYYAKGIKIYLKEEPKKEVN